MDCSIDWTDHKTAWVSVDDNAMINRVTRLKEQYPGEVDILFTPGNNNGMLVAKLPRKWIKINPPRKMSDEQRKQASERLARIRGERS